MKNIRKLLSVALSVSMLNAYILPVSAENNILPEIFYGSATEEYQMSVPYVFCPVGQNLCIVEKDGNLLTEKITLTENGLTRKQTGNNACFYFAQADTGYYIRSCLTDAYWSFVNDSYVLTENASEASVFSFSLSSTAGAYVVDTQTKSGIKIQDGTVSRDKANTMTTSLQLMKMKDYAQIYLYTTSDGGSYDIKTTAYVYSDETFTFPQLEGYGTYVVSEWVKYDTATHSKTEQTYAIGESITVKNADVYVAEYRSTAEYFTATLNQFPEGMETKKQIQAGEVCKLTMDTSGGRIRAKTVSGKEITCYNGGDYFWFTMPAEDVSVWYDSYYTLSGKKSGCTVEYPAKSFAGERVTIKATALEDCDASKCEFSLCNATTGEKITVESMQVSDNVMTITFVMPECDLSFLCVMPSNDGESANCPLTYSAVNCQVQSIKQEVVNNKNTLSFIIQGKEANSNAELLLVSAKDSKGEILSVTKKDNTDGTVTVVVDSLPADGLTVDFLMQSSENTEKSTVTLQNFDIQGEKVFEKDKGSVFQIEMDTTEGVILASDADGNPIEVWNGKTYYWFYVSASEVVLTYYPYNQIDASAFGCKITLPAKGYEGEIISVSYEALDGFGVPECKIWDAQGKEISLKKVENQNQYTFVMPKGSVVFEAKSPILVDNMKFDIATENCTVTGYSRKDASLSLVITANEGYDIMNLTPSFNYSKSSSITWSLKDYTENSCVLSLDMKLTADAQVTLAIESGEQSSLMGDANLDGAITIADSILMNSVLRDVATLNAEAKKNADLDHDNSITSLDVSILSDYLSGKISYEDMVKK